MIMKVVPHLGWPQSHADWTVTWEALGAIGTIAAVVVALHLSQKETRLRLQNDERDKSEYGLSVSIVSQICNTEAGEKWIRIIISNDSLSSIRYISYLSESGTPGSYINNIFKDNNLIRPQCEQSYYIPLKPLDLFEYKILFTDRYNQIWCSSIIPDNFGNRRVKRSIEIVDPENLVIYTRIDYLDPEPVEN